MVRSLICQSPAPSNVQVFGMFQKNYNRLFLRGALLKRMTMRMRMLMLTQQAWLTQHHNMFTNIA